MTTVWDWVQEGVKRGFCSEPFCGPHDAWPMTKEENDEDDPCIMVVRIIRDEVERAALQ